MKIGVIYPQTELRGDPEAVRRLCVAAEQLGYDFLVAYDHVVGAPHDREPKLQGPYTEKHPFHDPFVMFSHLAALTQKIEFVAGVLILPQRQTVLVAKQAVDLDLLSGERFRLGVGLGWNYVEYDALGQNFATRGKRLNEQVTLLRELWTKEIVKFQGEFDQVDRAGLNPLPRRQIPIWVGGFADAALRRGAKIGDGFIFADGAADALDAVQRVQEYVRAEGRSVETFGLQINMLRAKTTEAVVETVQRWRDVGGTHAAVNTMGQELTTIDQHLGFMERSRDALRRAGF